MSDRAEGKIAFHVSHSADRRQVLGEHSGRRLVKQLVTGANQEILRVGLVKDLFRIFDPLRKRFLDVVYDLPLLTLRVRETHRRPEAYKRARRQVARQPAVLQEWRSS